MGLKKIEGYGWVAKQCLHPEHNPPMHIHIPPGYVYEHICPACGQKRVIQGSNTSLAEPTTYSKVDGKPTRETFR
jgi:hypothetical protein